MRTARKNILFLMLLLVVPVTVAFAQSESRQKPTVRRRGAGHKSVAAKPSPTPTPAPPVALLNNAPEYASGEVNVSVKGNQNPIIRLGLAQNGVTLIEFPASDSFFYIHPGNSDLIAFDQETAEKSRRSLVLRPGASFVSPPAGSTSKGPSGAISVQMQSGLVVTFLIYPVRDLSQNAHRCVVMYNRDEVVASRRAAGLAVNLDGRDPQSPKKDTAVRIGDYPTDPNGDPLMISGPKNGLMVDVNSEQADARARAGKSSKKKPKVAEAANRGLKDAVKAPAKLGTYSKPSHGLSLVVAPAVDLDAQTRLVVVGVRNETRDGLRITAGNPELYVQTFDDQGKALQIEPVRKVHVESTSLDGKVEAGAVAYYAIVYESPVMGTRQRLRVSVSQTNAADDPVTSSLNGEVKKN